MPWVFLRLWLFIGLKLARMRSFPALVLMQIFGGGSFGRGFALCGLPSLGMVRPLPFFLLYDALPVRSLLFCHCFGGCSFGWSFCFPLAVSLVSRPWWLFWLFPCLPLFLFFDLFRLAFCLRFSRFIWLSYLPI